MTPFPFILSAPSGGGKTTIARRMMERRSDVGSSVSCTTRAPRAGEVHGRDYYFLSPTEFERQRAAGAFAESAEVHGLMYGTLHSEVHRVLDAGRHVLMAIDVQGAAQFVKSFPQSVLVFLLPPSAAELLRRLQRRDSEDPDSMARRVRSALMELGCVEQYEYVIVNDNLDRAVSDACSILDAENHRRCRLMPQLSSRLASLTHGLQHEPQSLTT